MKNTTERSRNGKAHGEDPRAATTGHWYDDAIGAIKASDPIVLQDPSLDFVRPQSIGKNGHGLRSKAKIDLG